MRYVKHGAAFPQVKLHVSTLIADRPRLRVWLAVLIVWLLGAAVLLNRIARPRTAARDIDESYWIGSAYYHHLAFKQFAWRHPDWGLLPARENPPLTKYVIGVSLSLSGHEMQSIELLGSFFAIFEYLPKAWGENESRAKRLALAERVEPQLRDRIARGTEPPIAPPMLVAARRAMLACVGLASLAVLILGMISVGPVPALIASFGFLAHHHVAHYANHALSEAVVLLFSTVAALAIAALVRPISAESLPPRSAWRRGVVIGLLLGLACAAKMNALVLIVVYAVFVAITLMPLAQRYPRAALRHILVEGAVAAGSTLAIFVLINPAILNDPIGGLVAVVREHRITEGIQASFLEGHLTTLAQKIRAVAEVGYLGWGCFIGTAIAAGWALSTRLPLLRFLALWWLIAMAMVTWWIPFGWQRYLTPVLVPSLLLGAWAIWHLVVLFWSSTKKALADPA